MRASLDNRAAGKQRKHTAAVRVFIGIMGEWEVRMYERVSGSLSLMERMLFA